MINARCPSEHPPVKMGGDQLDRIKTEDASESPPNLLGFDTSLRSCSAGAGTELPSSLI